MKHVKLMILFAVMAGITGCSKQGLTVDPMEDKTVSSPSQSPSVPVESWGADLQGRYLYDPRDCTWTTQCGPGTGVSCSESSLLKVQRTDDTIRLELHLTGIVGRFFEGTLDANGVFNARHEFWPTTSYAMGQITEDTIEFQVIYQPDPTKWNCLAQFDYTGAPN